MRELGGEKGVANGLAGIFEAVCQPTFLIMSSMWYKREEQGKSYDHPVHLPTLF